MRRYFAHLMLRGSARRRSFSKGMGSGFTLHFGQEPMSVEYRGSICVRSQRSTCRLLFGSRGYGENLTWLRSFRDRIKEVNGLKH